MIHPFKCPHCGGMVRDLAWFCPFCESNLSQVYTKKQKPHCFIATAAYGTMWHKDIDILRDFRDNVLDKNFFGKSFIRFYYLVSPPIARVISRNRTLKTAARKLIKMILALMK